jgi:hypothetical protein
MSPTWSWRFFFDVLLDFFLVIFYCGYLPLCQGDLPVTIFCCSLFIIALLLCWGCIVTFTTVLTVYHNWIHPLHHLLYSPSSHSWNSFNKCHFSTFIHVYIIFPNHSPFHTLFLYPPLSHWYQIPDRTCFTFLCSPFLKKGNFVYLE